MRTLACVLALSVSTQAVPLAGASAELGSEHGSRLHTDIGEDEEPDIRRARIVDAPSDDDSIGHEPEEVDQVVMPSSEEQASFLAFIDTAVQALLTECGSSSARFASEAIGAPSLRRLTEDSPHGLISNSCFI